MKTALKIACGTGAISVLQLQAEGKKRLSIVEFLRGVQDLNDFRAE
jgi:methionyl-tRNA formyltransferase